MTSSKPAAVLRRWRASRRSCWFTLEQAGSFGTSGDKAVKPAGTDAERTRDGVGTERGRGRDGVGTERGRSSDCVLKRLLTTLCMVLTATAAWAQDPYRLASPVTNLATLFTDLFGPSGLIVDSEATLPGEQPH